MTTEGRLSYSYEDIIKYQVVNNKLPKDLIPYCVFDTNNNIPSLSNYEDTLNEITTNIMKGFDPNSIVFKNLVKLYINTVNQSNYNDVLQKLKMLDYLDKENIHFLASELIMGAIRCNISVRGFTFEEDPKYKTLPEICADVAKHFTTCMVKDDENINFHYEINSICRQYFTDFLDMNRSMDENNEDTSDNYKGFMTFMGLLYSRGVINIKIVIDCMDSIKRAIYATNCVAKEHMVISNNHNCCENSIRKLLGSKKGQDNKLSKLICYFDCNKCPHPTETNKFVTYRKHIECVNLHKGYCHLLNHVVRSLEIRAFSHLKTIEERDEFIKLNPGMPEDEMKNTINDRNSTIEIIEKLCSYVDVIIKSHQEMVNLNRCYDSVSSSAQSKSKLVAPLKNHSIIDHNTIGTQLNKLQDKLIEYNKTNNTRYVNATLIKTL